MSLIKPLDENEMLFIQFQKKEWLESLLSGEIRITQQNYYRHSRGENGDWEECRQRIVQDGQSKVLFGIGSTYIWSCSFVTHESLNTLRHFKGSNFGLLIMHPQEFIRGVELGIKHFEGLNFDGKFGVELSHGKVVYAKETLEIAADDNTNYNHWVKPERFSNEKEYRLVVHDVLPPHLISKFSRGKLDEKIEEIRVDFIEEAFYRLVINFDFRSSYQIYQWDEDLEAFK